MRNILVTAPVTQAHKDMLACAALDAKFIYTGKDEITAEQVQKADIIFGNVPPRLIEGATNLKLLQLYTAGTDGYLPVLPEGCRLANTTGAFGLAISEHLLAMLLALIKRLHQYRDNQAKRAWLDRGTVTSVEGATVVVLGLGDIGGEFARKCKALGAYTIGVRRTDANKPEYLDELVLADSLDAVLPRAQILAMALPGTPETTRILSRERIALLPDGAVVLNIGRGSAIDQEALADAIETRGLRAGLDVTDPEPLPPDNRLWGLENCIITPHVSGFFHLAATHDNMVKIACENISRLREGRELINLVNPETGYKLNKYDGGKDILK